MAMGVMGPSPEPQGPRRVGLVRGCLEGKQGPAVWNDKGSQGGQTLPAQSWNPSEGLGRTTDSWPPGSLAPSSGWPLAGPAQCLPGREGSGPLPAH